MKKILLAMICVLCLPGVAFGASPNALGQSKKPDGYPPALAYGQENTAPAPIQNMMPLPDYLGQDNVPLTKSEKKALRLSGGWAGRGAEPILSFNGKLLYVHGASMPTVIASPMQVSDVELQKGEKVHEIVVGDSARWMIESGSIGSGPSETVHLFIKPVDAGLESSAVVTTDRRVYHLRLISQRSGHTPYIGFTYSDQLKTVYAEQKAREEREKHWNSTDIDGKNVDLSKLNFAYTVKGSASWKPERVYDDGQQTFIRLPENAKTNEMPVLLVRKGKQSVMVNYRVVDQALVVDGLFDKISLILGVGKSQQEIQVLRGKK